MGPWTKGSVPGFEKGGPKMPKPYLGVWLDHRQAYLIWLDGNGECEVEYREGHYPQDGEKPGRAVAGRAGAYGGVAPHVHLEEKRHREAKLFYEEIFRFVRSKAKHVYIFGPGQARAELHRRLTAHKDFEGRVHAVESAGRMTRAQMVARVRRFFKVPRPAA